VRAAVLQAFGQPLALADVPEPSAGLGEVVVAVRAAGLCGTDLKIWNGSLGTPLPLIPGHEVSGVVTEIGADVRTRAVGDRVACYLYRPCGACQHCRAGQETLCATSKRLGFERNGGFAELVSVRAEEALPIPETLPAAAAAVTMDAVVTAWRALRSRGAVQTGESVAIVGTGGLGLSAVSVARHLGARVAAVDRSEERLRVARGLGAEIAAPVEEAERTVRRWAGGGVDLAVEMSGTADGFQLAARLARSGGRVVTVGYAPGRDYATESSRLVLGELTVIGSRAGTPRDAREALAAVEAGSIAPPPIARRVPLEELNDAYEALARGSVLGRIVVEP